MDATDNLGMEGGALHGPDLGNADIQPYRGLSAGQLAAQVGLGGLFLAGPPSETGFVMGSSSVGDGTLAPRFNRSRTADKTGSPAGRKRGPNGPPKLGPWCIRVTKRPITRFFFLRGMSRRDPRWRLRSEGEEVSKPP